MLTKLLSAAVIALLGGVVWLLLAQGSLEKSLADTKNSLELMEIERDGIRNQFELSLKERETTAKVTTEVAVRKEEIQTQQTTFTQQVQHEVNKLREAELQRPATATSQAQRSLDLANSVGSVVIDQLWHTYSNGVSNPGVVSTGAAASGL